MTIHQHETGRAELGHWYEGFLRPRLVAAVRRGDVSAARAAALGRLLEDLCEPDSRERRRVATASRGKLLSVLGRPESEATLADG